MDNKIFRVYMLIVLLMSGVLFSCNTAESKREETVESSIFDQDNLVAWCIVPFDSEKRGPEERVNMLAELKIKHLAWDWRTEHIPTFEQEIKLLKEQNINLQAVWMWVNGGEGPLVDENNNRILETMRKNDVKAEVWMSFNNSFFDSLSDDQRLNKAVKAVAEINERVQSQGSKLGLYNHGSWFGDPENQIKIIEAVGSDNIGIVYNFHHAHHEVDKFPELLKKMMPYLLCINLNGMKTDGDKILPLGGGNAELGMMQEMVNAGYNGPVGILGHVDDRDVKEVLQENLKGLRTLTGQLKTDTK